ncbi:IucA/IucC family protein [Chenggangzhangella methanolivorans]
MAEEPQDRTLRQLVEAMLFEGVVRAEETDGPQGRRFSWTAGGRAFRCLGRRRGFGRVRVDPATIETEDGKGGWLRAGLRDVVESAADSPERAATFLAELERTVELCRWNALHAPRGDRRSLAFRELDAAIDEGHAYHPSFKARTGFSLEDHADFGPEAGATFRLAFLAVRRDLVAQTLPADEDAFWRAELGEAEAADLIARRAAAGLDAKAFALVPVHPWQLRKLADGPLAELIEQGAVHALGEAGPLYLASQSVRTLHNADEATRPSVKLAMTMANTSSLRTIEPHSVCVAPAISMWLGQIVERDPELRERIAILSEYAGMVVDREGALAGHVAAIWRESVASLLKPGEAAVPFNALMAEEADGRLFCAPWLDRHGAEAWAERLAEVVAGPVWRLLAVHGIALEAHGQNMVLVHRDGWPERLILRDFHDSLEYAPDFLAKPAAAPDLAAIDPVYADAPANQFHRMDRVEELRALVADCLFVFCLSDLAEALERHGALAETQLWALIDERLSRETVPPLRAARLGWRAECVAVERLVAPKFSGEAARFVEVPNVFAQRAKGARMPMIEIDERGFDRDAFGALSGRWAERVRLGRAGGGRRYAVLLPETADWLALFLAIREAGGGVLPIHPATPRTAARRLAERAGCDRLLLADGEVEILEPSEEPQSGVLLQMSSGTTGAPKCASRPWAEIEAELSAYVAGFPEPDDMTPVVACPTTHSYGLICGVLAGLKRGRAPKIVNAQNPKSLIRILKETEKPLLYSSPAVLHTLAQLMPAGETIHGVMTSGALLPAPWFAKIRERSDHMFQQYGCSEAGVVAVNREVTAADEMGRALPHLRLSAGGSREAPGEILVDVAGRRVETHDLGYLKTDGTLVFVSRLDDTINVSGLNVYPGEVEDAAMAHPDVSDAVAFRIADPFAGERVGLIVVGERRIDESALRDWCRANLAGHQTPAAILQVEAAPRQANGKVSRREVAALYAERKLATLTEAAR